jgi:hypothetical protein
VSEFSFPARIVAKLPAVAAAKAQNMPIFTEIAKYACAKIAGNFVQFFAR